MEAAGLASSIITFIEFSYKLINGTVVIYKKTATGPAADPHISSVIDDLEDATKAMKNTRAASAGQTIPHQRELLMLADNCNELSNELIAILKDLERKTDGSKLWRSLQASWKIIRKSDKIAEIERNLNTYRLQLLLRLSLMLRDNEASIQSELEKMHRGNVEFFGRTIGELQSVQQSMKELDARLGAQAYQARQSPTIDADEVGVLPDIRGALSQITQTLERIPRHASADFHIIARLRFEAVHARVDSISKGDFGVFKKLLEDAGSVSDLKGVTIGDHPADTPLKDAQSALNHWLELGDKVLYISGKAGSGKSTLMKVMSQDAKLNDKLLAWAGGMKLVVARFFFWIAGDPLQNSLEGLYRSLLLEILQQFPELTIIVFPHHWKETSNYEGFVAPERFSFRLFELQDAMTRLVEGASDRFDHRFCFFIDGLDEYAGESIDHLKLAKQLHQWAQFPYIKICASSRPYEEFHTTFDACSRIDLHKLTGPDIFHYSRTELQSMDKSHLTSEQVEDLVKNIESHAEGVFLWARLVVHSLCQGILHLDTYEALQRKLSQNPESLMKLFLHLFRQISAADKTRAYRLLRLLTVKRLSFDRLNAIMVSWIDNLQDTAFPYNVPHAAYTVNEVERRIEYADRQLKLMCNGLLEIRHEFISGHEKSAVDIYFQRSICLYHRAALDFLNHPDTMSAIQKHIGESTTISDDILRLRVAEIKFTRMYRHDGTQAEPETQRHNRHLQHRFEDVCRKGRKLPQVLEECEKIFQRYGEHNSLLEGPGRNGCSLGRLFDGTFPGVRYCVSTNLDGSEEIHMTAMSWIHYLAYIGAASDFIIDRVKSGAIERSSPDLCLVLSASLGPSSELVECLLNHGLQLRDRVKFNGKGHRSDNSQYVHGWVAFLAVLGARGAFVRRRVDLVRLYASLESLSRRQRGADLDVSMEYQHKLTRESTWEEGGPVCGTYRMALEELILRVRPLNMDALLGLIQSRKSWTGWARHLASRTLGGASTQFLPSSEAALPNILPTPADDANFYDEGALKHIYRLKSIYVGGVKYEIGLDAGVRKY